MLNPITESGRSLHLIEQRFDTQVDARFFIERVFNWCVVIGLALDSLRLFSQILPAHG